MAFVTSDLGKWRVKIWDFGKEKLKIDSTLKLPKKAELDSVRLTEIWKKRPITWNQTSLDPLVAGYGFGARTTLFGFFLRADYGWGIETRKVQDPMWHLAMGVDF